MADSMIFSYERCKRAGFSASSSTLALQGSPSGSIVSPLIRRRYGFRLTVTYFTAGEMTLAAGQGSVRGTTENASSAGEDAVLTLSVPVPETSFSITNSSSGNSLVYISKIQLSPLTAGEVSGISTVEDDVNAVNGRIYDLSGRVIPAVRRGVLLKGRCKVLVR